MALQGTIDAFPLTDVLQLLSSSARSGWLLVEGDRGRAALHIEQGSVVGGLGAGAVQSGAAPTDAVQLVTEVLRFSDGSFVFGPDDPGPVGASVAVDPLELMGCIAAADELLGHWRQLDAVVPSGAHRIDLPEDLPEESVVLTRAEWPLLVAAGHGLAVRDTAAWLGMSELDCVTSIAGLVERGVLRVIEPAVIDPVVIEPAVIEPAAFEPVTTFETPATERSAAFEPAAAFEPDAAVPAAAFRSDEPEADFPDRFPIDDLMDTPAADVFGAAPAAPAASWPAFPSPQEPAGTAFAAPEEPADEVMRQMSRLSPKAAEAIAAALSTAPGDPVAPAPPSTLLDEPPAPDSEGPITYSGTF